MRYDVPYEFYRTPEQAACRIERMCWYFWKDRCRPFRKLPPCPVPPAAPPEPTATLLVPILNEP